MQRRRKRREAGEEVRGTPKGKRWRRTDVGVRTALTQVDRVWGGFIPTLTPASFTQGSHGGDSRNKGETSHNVTNVIKV